MMTRRDFRTPALRAFAGLLWLTSASHLVGCGGGTHGTAGTGTGGAVGGAGRIRRGYGRHVPRRSTRGTGRLHHQLSDGRPDPWRWRRHGGAGVRRSGEPARSDRRHALPGEQCRRLRDGRRRAGRHHLDAPGGDPQGPVAAAALQRTGPASADGRAGRRHRGRFGCRCSDDRAARPGWLPGEHGHLPVAAPRAARRQDGRSGARAQLRAEAARTAQVLLLSGERARAAGQRADASARRRCCAFA